MASAQHPSRGEPHCAHCSRTDELCGVNGVWYCPDHVALGIGQAFVPARHLRSITGDKQ